jgi:SAM-dependent methyltransferase
MASADTLTTRALRKARSSKQFARANVIARHLTSLQGIRSLVFYGGYRVAGRPAIWDLAPKVRLRYAYNAFLLREPDEGGFATNLDHVKHGISWAALAGRMRASEEFQVRVPIPELLQSLHASRCAFIRTLPRATRIVDLGGTHLARKEGALVALGYPYAFERLTIVDLPDDDRHESYRGNSDSDVVETDIGTVEYSYHSMADLTRFDDGTIDLVYSGQSIEHVPVEVGKHVIAEVFRVLRPGGHFALDTPNGSVCRLFSEALIDPDHDVEYTVPELVAMLEAAGFEVIRKHGLNWGGPKVRDGVWDEAAASANGGLYDVAEECFLMALVCRKP